MAELTRISKALREWGRGQKEPLAHYGICARFPLMWTLSHATTDNLFQEAFRSWPKFSGCRMYPAPDPEARSDFSAARRIYHARKNLWEDSPYGNLRRELCLHVADWLETNKSKVLPLFGEKPHG